MGLGWGWVSRRVSFNEKQPSEISRCDVTAGPRLRQPACEQTFLSAALFFFSDYLGLHHRAERGGGGGGGGGGGERETLNSPISLST